MKQTFLMLALGIAVAAVAMSPLNWTATSLDLGEVKVNESIDLSFEFTNNASIPVSIVSAKGSCGCTQVEFPRESIAPGKSAKITGSFKSSKSGVFSKTIKVMTSASEAPTILSFKGTAI